MTFTFSEEPIGFNDADVTMANGSLSDISGSGTTYTATFTPTAGVTDATNVVTVGTDWTDAADNAPAASTESDNYTIDTTAPTLSNLSPADDATGVPVSANLVLTLWEEVKAGTGTITLYKATDPTTPVESFNVAVSSRLTFSGATVTIDPTAALDYSAGYHLTVDAGAIEDLAGNAYTGFSEATVYNFTTQAAPSPPPVSPPPPSRTETVDGMVVTQRTSTDADGTTTQITEIPIVTPSRQEDSGTSTATAADIPLARTATGEIRLEAAIPVGVGLRVESSQPTDGIMGLIRAIQARTTNQDQVQDRAAMTGVGTTFLDVLPTDTDLMVRTLIPVVAGDAPPAAPIVISASADRGARQEALVIDAQGLPSGTVLQLDNVEFAAVLGAVRVTGGIGAQMVVGDKAAQYIVLGEDDDTLRGGDGDDVVGSEGGDDLIFGDGGNDTLFGGAGNDTIDGGSGYDTLVLAGASRHDYILRVSDGGVVFTHRDGGVDGVDLVHGVELLRFAGGDLDVNRSDVATLVRLYDTLFARLPDLEGLNSWLSAVEQGMSLREAAWHFAASAEFVQRYGTLDDTGFVDLLYRVAFDREGEEPGRTAWIEHLHQGGDRGTVLLGFADSVEEIGLIGLINTSIATQ